MWSDSELTVTPPIAGLLSLLVSKNTRTQWVHTNIHALGAYVCEHTHTHTHTEIKILNIRYSSEKETERESKS